MESEPVTLIVKAPNQQIEDQMINCETSWTINKLKKHLSEVYPSKPPHHEQKLIYSGQLLNDSSILKDILRQYEGQYIYTLHLVCPTKNVVTGPVVERSKRSNNSNSNMDSYNRPNGYNNNLIENNYDRSDIQNGNNRMPPAFVTADHHRFQRFNPQAGQTPLFHMSNPNQYQLQMAWMQQTYIQYMAQYMQIIGTPTHTNTSSHFIPSNQQTDIQSQEFINGEGGDQRHQLNPAATAGAAAPPPPPPPLQEPEERDWLDIFYTLSRALVLFSFVYFYSSPLRFIFVLLLVTVLYLYHTGFFRNNHLHGNVNVGGGGGVVDGGMPAPSRLMLAWTFISTFFASLIPDIPNINV